MSFSVPKEYSEFVTNAGDLLDQFNSGSSALETVSYSIHPLNCDVLKAMDILGQATSVLEPLLSEYVWHMESFRLVIKANPGEPISLFGTTCIGECIEDEWFIVYLLLKVSQQIPDIVISVVDTDGQFLLIEAADYIEDWVGPENADNRVWIKNGSFHIIPLDEPGRMKTGGMKLDRAIKTLLDADSCKRNFGANEGFHRTIYQRTLNAFPARALANRHSALCIVPGWLAELINANPRIVARAVVDFHNADKDQLRQACAASGGGKSSTNKFIDQRLVLMPVQFTRALYAQLTFKNFHPPRKYHAMMRRVAEASSRKVSHAFDLGCRLACGVDCAYYNSKDANEINSSSLETNLAWLELLNIVRSGGPVDEGLRHQLQTLFQSGQITSSANFERARLNDSVFPGGFKHCVDTISSRPSGSVSTDFDQDEADRAVFRSLVEGEVRGDEEDWLFMTPEELDKEMQSRVDRFASASGDASVPSSVAEKSPVSSAVGANDSPALAPLPLTDEASEEQASAAALQSMLDGFKTFMEGSSDVDGISFRPDASPSKKVIPAPESTGSLQLDYDFLESLLQGGVLPSQAVPSSVSSSAAADEADEAGAAAEKEKADLAGYFSKEDLRQLDSDGEEENSEDSDSEDEDDREGAYAADQYLSNILQSADKSHTESAPKKPEETTDSALLGVGGGYLHPNSGKRRGASVDVDSDDEVEEVPNGAHGIRSWREEVQEEEEEEEEDDEMDEDLIREYQKLMDSELFQDSSLAETFEWTAEDRAGGDDVDVDMNLLKNLMEAQSQGMGSPLAGPLGQLMAQLGIKMPMPPPMKQRP